MTQIRREGEGFVVEAALLCDVFGLAEDEVRARMRDGAITTRCETGVDEDSGRWRLTFVHGDRACRFIVDDAGTILRRVTFPVRPAGPPSAAPGADARKLP